MSRNPITIRWPILGSPPIRIAGRFEEPGRTDLVHCLPFVALHVYEYVGALWVDGHRLDLRPGDVTLTPARLPSWYRIKKPGFHLCIHFEVLPEAAQSVALPIHVRPIVGHQAVEKMQHLVELHHASSDEAPGGPAHLAAQAALQAFLLWLHALQIRARTAGPAIPSATAEALQRLRALLDARYRERWTGAQLARAAGLSPAYLARMFRRQFGMTMQRYILHRRIDYARLLLLTRDSVKTVAYESGFSNPQYFCRQFRLATGETPSQLRESYHR